MQQQYQQIVRYVSSIVKRKTLPKPIISELQMILIRLGIDGFGTGAQWGSGSNAFGGQFISIRQLVAKLSSSSSANFGVTRSRDCNIESFCTDRYIRVLDNPTFGVTFKFEHPGVCLYLWCWRVQIHSHTEGEQSHL